MKIIFSSLIMFFCLFAGFAEANSVHKVTGVHGINGSRTKIMTLADESVWVIPNEQYFWVGYPVTLGSDDPDIGQIYPFLFWYHDSEYNTKMHTVDGFLLARQPDLSHEIEGTVATLPIANVFRIPGRFGLADKSAVLLEDGRAWIISTFQNTFQAGDEISVFKENENLAYLIKIVQVGDAEKEIFIPSKRVVDGIYIVE